MGLKVDHFSFITSLCFKIVPIFFSSQLEWEKRRHSLPVLQLRNLKFRGGTEMKVQGGTGWEVWRKAFLARVQVTQST